MENIEEKKVAITSTLRYFQGVWKCNLPALLGNYDGPIKQPTDGHESS